MHNAVEFPTGFDRERMPQNHCRVCTVGVQMPQYLFTVRADSADVQESAADLRDDAAALEYAFELVRAHRASALGGSLVWVRDETRPIVFSIPFLPGCA
jgi:hypothetical protein